MSLRQSQHPLICQIADTIEATWQQHLPLSPYHLPEDLGYVEGRLEGEKVTIENACYQAQPFRKLHLELARVGNSLDILHCVMFPDPSYRLPVFGTDLVGSRGQLSAAIVDLSPIGDDLGEGYRQALTALPKFEFSQPRSLPDWADIFSDFCLFVRLETEPEQQQFLQTMKGYLEVHCQQAIAAKPVSAADRENVLQDQRYYCTQQRKNDKTRRVLEKAFGTEWADRYMTTVLFDDPQ